MRVDVSQYVLQNITKIYHSFVINLKSIGGTFACCTVCSKDFNGSHDGQNDVLKHVKWVC